jgi:dUTP pyrophosphatase
MKMFVQKLNDKAIIPVRAHHDDAGLDLFCYEEHTLLPGVLHKVPLGVAFEIPEGYVGLIWDKSSIGSKGIKTLGGVVDAGYRGEVQVVLCNCTQESYYFKAGQKVAQMLIQKVEFPEIEEVSELSDSSRGENGFGSTGK